MLNFAVISLMLLVITACSVASMDSSNKTRGGLTNGEWIGKTLRTAPSQQVGDRVLACSPENIELSMRINDGMVVGHIVEDKTLQFRALLSSSGRFFHRIPVSSGFYALSSSELEVAQAGPVDYLTFDVEVDGDTGKGEGVFAVVQSDMGMEGCKTAMEFRRI